MSTWPTVQLGDVVELVRERVTGAELTVYVDTLLPGYEGIGESVPGRGVDEALVAFDVDDILIGNIRPYLKKIWRADRDGGASPDVVVIRPVGVDASYLYAALATEEFFGHVMRGVKGSKMPRGDKTQMLRYELPLPNLEEQQRFGALFALMDERRKTGQRLLERLAVEKQALQRQVFTEQVLRFA